MPARKRQALGGRRAKPAAHPPAFIEKDTPATQRGAALLILLLALVGVGALFGISSWLEMTSQRQSRDRDTRLLLAEAKEALLGYAATEYLEKGELRLPCPAPDQQGEKASSCNTATERLGRLPWKTLNFGPPVNPDEPDAVGKLPWYALSDQSQMGIPSKGTLTVRDAQGNVLYCAAASACPSGDTGAVAVIFAPGLPLQRQDGLIQNRKDFPNAAQHFLDKTDFEDNADFADNSGNGFFLGPVKSADGALIANDEAIVITKQDIDRLDENVRRRVAEAVRHCLLRYREEHGYFPWLVPLTDTTDYKAEDGRTFGRLPLNFSAVFPPGEEKDWTADCTLRAGNWWKNTVNSLKEQVFAAIDPACAPGGSNCPTACSLEVNGKPAQCLAVFVAGRALPGQNRTAPSQLVNYLEDDNYDGGTPASPFASCNRADCNDLVVSWKP